MKTMLVTLLTVAALGCSSSEPQGPTPTTGTPTPAPTDPAPSDPPAAPTLKAPTLDQLMKMSGSLHVVWTNAEASADAVILERKSVTAAYAVVATLPGNSDNLHDMAASEATTYTYRVRCKKGAEVSPYSNELSANPK
jgi:hypothetical protein